MIAGRHARVLVRAADRAYALNEVTQALAEGFRLVPRQLAAHCIHADFSAAQCQLLGGTGGSRPHSASTSFHLQQGPIHHDSIGGGDSSSSESNNSSKTNNIRKKDVQARPHTGEIFWFDHGAVVAWGLNERELEHVITRVDHRLARLLQIHRLRREPIGRPSSMLSALGSWLPQRFERQHEVPGKMTARHLASSSSSSSLLSSTSKSSSSSSSISSSPSISSSKSHENFKDVSKIDSDWENEKNESWTAKQRFVEKDQSRKDSNTVTKADDKRKDKKKNSSSHFSATSWSLYPYFGKQNFDPRSASKMKSQNPYSDSSITAASSSNVARLYGEGYELPRCPTGFSGLSMFVNSETISDLRLQEKMTLADAYSVMARLELLEKQAAPLAVNFATTWEQTELSHVSRPHSREINELRRLVHNANCIMSKIDDVLSSPDFYWNECRLGKLYDAVVSRWAMRDRGERLREQLEDSLRVAAMAQEQHRVRYDVLIVWIIVILVAAACIHTFEVGLQALFDYVSGRFYAHRDPSSSSFSALASPVIGDPKEPQKKKSEENPS